MCDILKRVIWFLLFVTCHPVVNGQATRRNGEVPVWLLDKVHTLEAQGKDQAIHIKQLEDLVQALRSTLLELASNKEEPRLVQLTHTEAHGAAGGLEQNNLSRKEFVETDTHRNNERLDGESGDASEMTERHEPSTTATGKTHQVSRVEPIAFCAWVTNFTSYNGRDKTVVFDHVITNNGGGYHGDTGIFVAPMIGFYVITVSLDVQFNSPNYVYGNLMKNGDVFSALFFFDDGFQKQVSVTVVVPLAVGDELSVAVGMEQFTLNLREKGASSFTGFLLT